MPPVTRSAARQARNRTAATPYSLPSTPPSKVASTSTTPVRPCKTAKKRITKVNVAQVRRAGGKRSRRNAEFEAHCPTKDLCPEYYPSASPDYRPPLRVYGWAFDDAYLLELARRRRLTFNIEEYDRSHFGNADMFNFADLTEEHLTNKRLHDKMQILARLAVELYFIKSLHFCPDIERPYAPGRRKVLVVWTNYDMHRKHRLYDTFNMGARKGGWKMMKEFLQEAMNEGLPVGVEPSEPMWWWSKGSPPSDPIDPDEL